MFQVGGATNYVRWNRKYFFVVLPSLVRLMLLMSDDDSEATMVGGVLDQNAVMMYIRGGYI